VRSASSPGNQSGNSSALGAIGWGGLVAGTLDICSAFVIWGLRGAPPTRVLQAVASGLLGRASFEGGARTATLGLGLHFLIAFFAAAVFYLASRRLSFLTRRPIVTGLVYGVVVHAVMNCIVLPLSAASPRHSVASVVIQIIIHMLFVGLPISLATRRFSGSRPISG